MFTLRIEDLEDTNRALGLAAKGHTVYMTETGKLKTKPAADTVRLIEGFDINELGYVFKKFSPSEDIEDGLGGWGYTLHGEPCKLGGTKAEAWNCMIDHVEADGHLRHIERQIRARLDALIEISPALWDADGGDHSEYLNDMGIDPQAVLNA